jgi:NAD(P)-dependent dehydrogenase (short-subunit alcohol dehydrogenase family)
MGKLEGKVAVITGGSSGLALASAKRFVEEGAYVFITGRRQEALDEAVKLIGRNVTGGSNVEAIYKLDKRNAFAAPHDPEAREMVYNRTAAGARMLRDLVYRAWLESALPASSNLPNPIDLSNPLYNPQTDSAPASQSPELSR